MGAVTRMIVPFHGDELLIVEHNGQPYAPMKPIVEAMGLDWKSQYRKIASKFKSCMVKMTIQMLGDNQSREVIMMPIRKLPAWLYSVEPNMVKPKLRDKIVMYQEECDDVLWSHWEKKNNARHFAYEELNKLYLAAAISEEKGTFHGYGLQRRKIEKRTIGEKIEQCEAKFQLTFLGEENAVQA